VVFYSIYYFTFIKKKFELDELSEISNSNAIDFKMLLCLSIALLFILYEIIFLNYRSITFYMDSKITAKILPRREEILPQVKKPEQKVAVPKPEFIRKFLEKRSLRLNLGQELVPSNRVEGQFRGTLAPVPGLDGSHEFAQNESQLPPKEKQAEVNRVSYQKFREVALKVRLLTKVMNTLTAKAVNNTPHTFNTSIKKYFSNLLIWTAIFLIICVWEPSFDEDLKTYSFSHLVRRPIGVHGQIILFFVALYVAFDCFELNRYRKTTYTSILNQNFKNKFNMILFKIAVAVPFFVEVTTVLNFISNKTSLDIFKWYKIEDIKRILISAKFINVSQKQKIVGYEEPKYMKVIFSYGFFAVFFMIITAPFWLFSNLNPLVGAPEISNVNFRVFIKPDQRDYRLANDLILSEINLFNPTPYSTQDRVEISQFRSFTDDEFNKLKVS
jgi:hypothetical protein